ncbi:MAG TPA: hypothetical protein VGG41_11705 [Solirubrobacteraceae bacterium]
MAPILVTVAVIVGATVTASASTARFASPSVDPISVHIGKLVKSCEANGKLCSPGLNRTVTISFVSHEKLAAGVSWYEMNLRFMNTGPCPVDQGGMGGPTTPSALRVGQRATWSNEIIDCPRVVYGAIVYDTSRAPHTHVVVPHVGGIDGALVGTFSFRMT